MYYIIKGKDSDRNIMYVSRIYRPTNSNDIKCAMLFEREIDAEDFIKENFNVATRTFKNLEIIPAEVTIIEKQ